MKKSCKKGYYYCFTSKKCKKIPVGYHVMGSGRLMKDSDHEEGNGGEESTDTTKNGKTNGNGNGGNGGAVSEAKEKGDHEVSMAKTQVKKSIDNLQKVAKVLAKKTDADNLPAWVQSKLTDTEHNTDAAASYMTGKEDLDEGKRDGKSAKDKGYSLRDWFKGGGWVQAGGKYDGKPCAKQPGQKTKPFCRDADDRASMSKKERNRRAAKKRKEDPNPNRKGKAKMVTDDYSNWRQELELLEGKKDACYHKVKSRYSVWPSAYASGALVKCRKVGAKNWGNKTKKESYEYSNWKDDFQPIEVETVDLIKAEPLISEKNDGPSTPVKMDPHMNRLVPNQGAGRPGKIRLKQPMLQNAGYQPEGEVIDEAGKKCWKGYEKKGTQKLFGKTYNRCVKKEEFSNWREELSEKYAGAGDKGMPGWKPYGGRETGPVQDPNYLYDRIENIRKSIPVKKASTKKTTQVAHFEPEGEIIEDWQKVNKKDKTDGMSQKAVNAYRRENPGSKLKTAVTGKVKKGSKDAKRRKSFCSRSDGQRKMHNIDCSKTPDKAICKARRRWKC